MNPTITEAQQQAPESVLPDLDSWVEAIDKENGRRFWVDPTSLHTVTEQPTTAPQESPAPAVQPTPQPVDTRISSRAKGAALVTGVAGASLSAVTLAVGQVAPQLLTAGHAVEYAGFGVGITAASVIAVKVAFGLGGKGRGKTVINHTETHNHQTTNNVRGFLNRSASTTSSTSSTVYGRR